MKRIRPVFKMSRTYTSVSTLPESYGNIRLYCVCSTALVPTWMLEFCELYPTRLQARMSRVAFRQRAYDEFVRQLMGLRP